MMLNKQLMKAVLGHTCNGRVIVGNSRPHIRLSRCLNTTNQDSSTSAQVKEVSDNEPTQQSIVRKPKRPPFIKNLFLGRFDKEMLTYPEVLDKDRHELLHEMIVPIERFFEEQVDGEKIDKEAKIPPETLQGLKDLGLYGQQIPEEYGGLGLGATEYARIAEITAIDGSIAVTLAAHQAIGLKGILIAGTNEQKEKYLPQLACGEWTAAFCLTEPSSGSDAASIQTRATLSEDGTTWLLNGSKIWISNGGYADLMTVFAKTPEVLPSGEVREKVTAFIVERGFGGVSSGTPEDKMGIRGSNTCEVYFDNTPVPAENVLGEVGGGFKVAMNILNSGRFSMGSSGAGILKKIMGWALEHAVTRKQFGHHLSEFAMIKEKFARMSVAIYAMESMAYLTAGMIDGQEEADCSVEAAIVKVFSSEAAWHWGSECLQILGGLGYMKSYPFERYLRDARILLIFEGTNEILRLQHAGNEMKGMIQKLRNPLMNPGFILGKGIERIRQHKDNPKLDLNLSDSLHPSLKAAGDILEYCVKRFQYSVETVLARHGREVADPKNQLELARLANCAMDIFAMTAVLSRASRAYCIGVRNSSHEVQLAMTFCDEASARIKTMVKDIENGPFISNDSTYAKIADTVIEHGGYAAEHPLTRVFW
ncbi:Complex I assembly factor ACAD9-like [Homarus americanus]|uniref:Complex I assembly factor ACAD9-like n=1 Tax=Homarus americanus TaxID=6706 RepID=A0A8J5JVP7_HOMAM|nr:Complex I assembly factor ACAD9-like [Homarus americanus]